MSRPHVTVVMPAYNAAATLERTVRELPLVMIDELIVVDDCSPDATQQVAGAVSGALADEYPAVRMTVIRHDRNTGYGGNQKTCYDTALAHGADIVVMVHADYQYDPKLVRYFIDFIRDGYFDVMLGSRIRSREEALAGGMPRYKYYANRVLSFFENVISGRNISEWHSGMRAYSKQALMSVDYASFSDNFVFDTQMMFALVEAGRSIGDIPVPVRYFKEASSIQFLPSVEYGLSTVWEMARFVARTYRQFFRYLIVGAASVGTNIAAYWFLLAAMRMWYVGAACIAFACGGVVAFVCHAAWTFGIPAASRRQAAVKYVAAIGVSAALNACMLSMLVHLCIVPVFFANIVSNAIVLFWNFFMLRRVVFAGARPAAMR